MTGPVVFCPHCNFDEEGATTFAGELFNPCDPGCCCTLACPKCGRVYKLVEVCKPPCECHYHELLRMYELPDSTIEGMGLDEYLTARGFKECWPTNDNRDNA